MAKPIPLPSEDYTLLYPENQRYLNGEMQMPYQEDEVRYNIIKRMRMYSDVTYVDTDQNRTTTIRSTLALLGIFFGSFSVTVILMIMTFSAELLWFINLFFMICALAVFLFIGTPMFIIPLFYALGLKIDRFAVWVHYNRLGTPRVTIETVKQVVYVEEEKRHFVQTTFTSQVPNSITENGYFTTQSPPPVGAKVVAVHTSWVMILL